ncbi:MAG: alpha/beta hydrolase [Lachnospiraceae bacterium]|nr:alpha/beta hydrolase [Lachnospiraceae bacterium]
MRDFITGNVTVQNTDVLYRLYADIPYVERPNAPELQVMNLYVPEVEKDAPKMPVFIYQETGGMGQAAAPVLGKEHHGIIGRALAEGYIVACPGARGRDTVVDGVYVGRGDLPMTIIDLKAAVRWLRRHQDEFPADTDKIFFDGTSSGGGMATLMGATGNSPKYEPYLDEIGAAKERDDIFCAVVNSPITDFAHIDLAYEWLFSADRVPGLYEGNEKDADVSRRMAKAFEEYVNQLHLTDPESGNLLGFADIDTYSPYLLKKLSEAATKYLSEMSEEERTAWLEDEFNKPVLKWNGEKADITDLKAYVNWNTGRWMKYLGCYDAFIAKPSRENEAFGTQDGSSGHFSVRMGEILADSKDYAKEGQEWIEAAKKNVNGEYLVNPMNFIGTDEVCTIAPHWYMRCGCHHETTGNIFLNLVLRILNCTDADVNWRYSWPMRHIGISDIEQDEAFAYFNRISK